MRPSTANAVVVAALLMTALCACKKTPDVKDAGLEPMVLRRVPDAPLVVSLPKSWKIQTPQVPPLMEPPWKDADPPSPKRAAPRDAGPNTDAGFDDVHPIDGGPSAIEAAARAYPTQSRTLVIARPPDVRPGSLVAPMLMILHDPWLPRGTTGVDYLVAQRATNQAVIGGNIRHVEAEPSRRQGRPSYHIRDEWKVPGPNGMEAEVSQEALLLLDADANNGGRWLHGYAVVITMEKRDLALYEPYVRAILESVGFKDRAVAQ